MAKHDGNMESSRELALNDKASVKRKYAPPPVTKLKHIIVDERYHCRYYYKTKKKFTIALKKFLKLPDHEGRFIVIHSK